MTGVFAVLVVVWLALTIAALLRLRRGEYEAIAQALWAAIIVLVPFLGAAAFFITRPAPVQQPPGTHSRT